MDKCYKEYIDFGYELSHLNNATIATRIKHKHDKRESCLVYSTNRSAVAKRMSHAPSRRKTHAL